jgi:hypothetical protein
LRRLGTLLFENQRKLAAKEEEELSQNLRLTFIAPSGDAKRDDEFAGQAIANVDMMAPKLRGRTARHCSIDIVFQTTLSG